MYSTENGFNTNEEQNVSFFRKAIVPFNEVSTLKVYYERKHTQGLQTTSSTKLSPIIRGLPNFNLVPSKKRTASKVRVSVCLTRF